MPTTDATGSANWEIERGALLLEVRNLRSAFDAFTDSMRGLAADVNAQNLKIVKMEGDIHALESKYADLKEAFENLRKWGMGILGTLITSGAIFAFTQYIHSLQQAVKP